MTDTVNFRTSQGFPNPYGVTSFGSGFNFALFAKHATHVHLCLLQKETHKIVQEIALDPKKNKTGNIWHIFIHQLDTQFNYAYKLNGPSDLGYDISNLVLDPYAKDLSTSSKWGSNSSKEPPIRSYKPFGVLLPKLDFDWQKVNKPCHNMEDLIIYEMHIRGLTIHPSSGVKHPGTYLGVVEKIPYLLELGINAVELMPVHEFDENDNSFSNPETHQPLRNYWGYASVNFFTPMKRYAASNADYASVLEFKTMVRELHRHGIEVILDVVFNHTGEGNEMGPSLSFKGIDNYVYYLLDEEGKHTNYTGCGNTFNCNHQVVVDFIRDCLRYWVLEMHVDGFRFDLASILTRGKKGTLLNHAPVIEAITHDPLLSGVKLIAEPWDATGLYQVGTFHPEEPKWSEWNGKYRDAIRQFIKGTPGFKGEFVTRICGSQDIYTNRAPRSSINFIITHDGFSLYDLVSYNEKHNEANGEENRDGNSDNMSWNCGEEGPSENPEINSLRQRQIRNFHLALMISQGVPMVVMGDEYAHTKNGNNNTWSQDNELNWFLWDKKNANQNFWRFYSGLIRFRKKHPILKHNSFLTSQDVIWHGIKPLEPDWENTSPFIALTIVDELSGHDIYVAFNAQGSDVTIVLPPPKPGKAWHKIADTSAPSPEDFFEDQAAPRVDRLEYPLPSYSSLLLKAK